MPHWETLPAALLLDVLYSMLVDDATGLLVSRSEAMEEVDKLLFDPTGASRAELLRTWGRDSRSERDLTAATDMFKAANASGRG